MIRGFTAVTIASVFVAIGIASCGARTTTEDEFGLGGDETATGGASLGAGGKAASTGGIAGKGGVTGKGNGGYPSYGGVTGYGGKAGYGGTTAGGGPSYGGYPSFGGVTGYGGKAAGGQAAGATSGRLDASGFDQSCSYDNDCTSVAEGEQCGCAICPNAAINLSAYGSWSDYRNAIISRCGPEPPCDAVGCAATVPVCRRSTGKCDIRPDVYLTTSSYDRSCRYDEDCVAIYEGNPCSACRCQAGAVNVESGRAWFSQVMAIDCNPPPSTCDCAVQRDVRCDRAPSALTGTCVMASKIAIPPP